MRRPPATSTPGRDGFTLVELLVVIMIIAILIALLLPAVGAAVAAAQNARAGSEINNLQTAMSDFKNKYGEFPPSRIILHNNGFYNPTDPTHYGSGDLTFGDLNQRTIKALRKYFPRANNFFSSSGAVGAGFQLPWDNGSGAGLAILQGHECLVFFLGGIPVATHDAGGNVNGWSMSGFSRDPTAPFGTGGVISSGQNPTVPLYEFAPGRLQDVFSVGLTPNGVGALATGATGVQNGFPSFVDPLSSGPAYRPYAYFSAYGNNAYDPNDDNSAGLGNGVDPTSIETDDNAPPDLVGWHFAVNFVVQGGPTSQTALSLAPNPYTTSNPAGNVAWANPQTFQIISAGRDGLWGTGGTYDASSTAAKLPIYPVLSTPPDPPAAFLPSVRRREADNITNFAAGRLD